MQELQGVIDNIVFQSEDNQFSVFRVKTDHEGKVSVVYRGPAPFLGESVGLRYAGCFIFITASADRDFRYRQKEGRSYWDVLCRVVGYAGIDGVFGIARRQC